jgi:hypothetical protein
LLFPSYLPLSLIAPLLLLSLPLLIPIILLILETTGLGSVRVDLGLDSGGEVGRVISPYSLSLGTARIRRYTRIKERSRGREV